MKVEATKIGFYGGKRRHIGERFDVPDTAKAKWFVPLDNVKPEKPKQKAPDTFSEMAKADSKAQKPKGAKE